MYISCSFVSLNTTLNEACDHFSPGVIKTEIHKRGGMDEEAYQKVGKVMPLPL